MKIVLNLISYLFNILSPSICFPLSRAISEFARRPGPRLTTTDLTLFNCWVGWKHGTKMNTDTGKPFSCDSPLCFSHSFTSVKGFIFIEHSIHHFRSLTVWQIVRRHYLSTSEPVMILKLEGQCIQVRHTWLFETVVGPCPGAQSIRVSSWYATVVGLIPSQGMYNNQPINA